MGSTRIQAIAKFMQVINTIEVLSIWSRPKYQTSLAFVSVVYFNQLFGAKRSQKLVEIFCESENKNNELKDKIRVPPKGVDQL